MLEYDSEERSAPTTAYIETPSPEEELTVDMSVLNSLRDKAEYLGALGDPSREDSTKDKSSPDGAKIVKPKIVGYRFKVLEDMRVPDCGTTERFKRDLFDYKDAFHWRDAKAGEVVDMTMYEAVLFLSQPEFNGRCTGGKYQVRCSYTTAANKSAKNEGKGTRRASLRGLNGSIRDFPYFNVLEYTTFETEQGKSRKNRTINPGFEKWAPLAAVDRRKGTKATSTKDDELRVMAAAFYQSAQEKGRVIEKV